MRGGKDEPGQECRRVAVNLPQPPQDLNGRTPAFLLETVGSPS